MSVINYQCFILPKEAAQFFSSFTVDEEIYLYALWNENIINIKDQEDLFDNEIIYKGGFTLVLSPQIIAENSMRPMEFYKKYPNSLYFEIGEHDNDIIKESWLYSLKIATNETLNRKWKTIEYKLKQIMISGGYTVYTPNDRRKVNRTLRYTSKIFDRYKEGLTLIPSTGENIYFELGL